MQTKIITYKRILNLGNYESKHLDASIELVEGDDVDQETSELMKFVERKIREDSAHDIEEKIKQIKIELRDLQKEYQTVKTSLKELKPSQEKQVDIVANPF